MTNRNCQDGVRRTVHLRDRPAFDWDPRSGPDARGDGTIRVPDTLAGVARVRDDRAGGPVEVRLVTVRGRFAFGSSFRTPACDAESPQTTWSGWYDTPAEARAAAVAFVFAPPRAAGFSGTKPGG